MHHASLLHETIASRNIRTVNGQLGVQWQLQQLIDQYTAISVWVMLWLQLTEIQSTITLSGNIVSLTFPDIQNTRTKLKSILSAFLL